MYEECGLRWSGWGGALDQGLRGWGGVMAVFVESLDSLYRWQVQVSVYILLDGYLRIVDAPNVQSCYTLLISAS